MGCLVVWDSRLPLRNNPGINFGDPRNPNNQQLTIVWNQLSPVLSPLRKSQIAARKAIWVNQLNLKVKFSGEVLRVSSWSSFFLASNVGSCGRLLMKMAVHQSITLHVKDGSMHVHYPTCHVTTLVLHLQGTRRLRKSTRTSAADVLMIFWGHLFIIPQKWQQYIQQQAIAESIHSRYRILSTKTSF